MKDVRTETIADDLEAAYERCLAELRAMPTTKRYAARRRAVQERAAAIGAEMRKILGLEL